jgi:hypothetical protein
VFGFLKKSATPADAPERPNTGWTERLKAGLAKTRGAFTGQIEIGRASCRERVS